MSPHIQIPTADMAEALRTVAVNSAYHASRALSKWFKRGVRLTSEGFRFVPISELAAAAGEPDEAVAAVHLAVSGEISGNILLAFPEKVALRLIDIMIEAEDGTSTEFGELEQSCLQETGNIVGSAFANSLASWLGVEVTPQAPTFVHDLAAAVIQPLVLSQAANSDEALLADTEFEFDKERLDWRFVLLPSEESLVVMRRQCEGDEVRRHALQTIAINGAFEASRALSKWLRRGVRLSTDGFVRVPLRDACPVSQSEESVVALYACLGQQLHGHTLILMRCSTACELVDILCRQDPGTTTELNDLANSCLLETCNIVSSSFINSWSRWLDIHTEPGPPQMIVDMPEAILENLLVEQAMASDEVFMAKTEFSASGRWLEWDFYLLPTPSSLRLIETSCS